MKVGVIRERLLQRVVEVLAGATFEDLLIVADQLRVVAGALAHLDYDDEVTDLGSYTVDTAQAARLLSYHAEHVRRLIRQGALPATKVGADYRIPLAALFGALVGRHTEGPLARQVLLPVGRDGDRPPYENGAELIVDISVARDSASRPLRLRRTTVALRDVLQGLPGLSLLQPAISRVAG